jgi:hypothetical protein
MSTLLLAAVEAIATGCLLALVLMLFHWRE